MSKLRRLPPLAAVAYAHWLLCRAFKKFHPKLKVFKTDMSSDTLATARHNVVDDDSALQSAQAHAPASKRIERYTDAAAVLHNVWRCSEGSLLSLNQLAVLPVCGNNIQHHHGCAAC